MSGADSPPPSSDSRSRRLPAYAALAVALVMVSWAAVLIVLTRSGPIVVAFGRLALAFVFLAPLLGAAPVRRHFPPPRGVALPAVAAGPLLAAHLLLWIASLRLTTVAASMFLLASQAILALLLSKFLLREAVAPLGWAGVGLATIGVIVIGGGEVFEGRGLAGGLLAVLSAAAFVLYLAAGRRGRQRVPCIPWLLLLYGTAAAVLVPLLPLSHGPGAGIAREILLLVALALGPTILGHGLMNYALRDLRIHVVQLVALAEPFLAVLWAWWVLRERPSLWTWPGGLLVVAGCALAVWDERRSTS